MRRRHATPFGKTLRKLRVDLDESLTGFAHRLGYSPTFVSNVELGSKVPPTGIEEKIAEAYGFSAGRLDELRRLADRERPSFKITVNDPEVREIVGEIRRRGDRLDDVSRAQIKHILDKAKEVEDERG